MSQDYGGGRLGQKGVTRSQVRFGELREHVDDRQSRFAHADNASLVATVSAPLCRY
jgi:hypothetical protein